MSAPRATSTVVESIVAACYEGYPPERLKTEVLTRLRRLVPVDALWWATCDPATLLFTQAFREGIPDRTIAYFVDNEFGAADANQWTELARHPGGVRSLARATDDNLEASARFRDVFAPLGLGDELRAVLRTGDSCWGLMCLHRAAGSSFSASEVRLVRQLAPHLAEGIRAGLLMTGVIDMAGTDTPGLVILDAAGDVVAATEAARAWFAELGHDARHAAVPAEVATAAALLRRGTGSDAGPGTDPGTHPGTDYLVPRMRVRTRAGRWIVLHASWLNAAGSAADQVAVIIELATPIEVAEVIMRAYGLTERERSVTGLVCQGRSTAEIASALWISGNTVQDHLKSVFDKTGVRSRRELMAVILRDHYLPALGQSRQVAPTGFFR